MVVQSKVCFTCKAEKLLADFYSRLGVVGGASSCKECAKAYTRTYKKTIIGAEYHRKHNRIRYQRYKQRINSYYRIKRQNFKWKFVEQAGNKCNDCQQTYPIEVYDFHHLDATQKDGNIAQMKRKQMELEISKCVLLCANCHRIRHIKDIKDESNISRT